MKERPILFSGEMVRAIIEGRKTQTRRVVKPQPKTISSDYSLVLPGEGCPRHWQNSFGLMFEAYRVNDGILRDYIKCPYGQPGDRLWVREPWRVGAWDENYGIAIDYKADGFCRDEWIAVEDCEYFEKILQQSTDDAIKKFGQQDAYEWKPGESPCRWRPSIFMPRWASRITLEITNVRVERIQDITKADAKLEGAEFAKGEWGELDAFNYIWDSINAKRGYGWDTNPWVWVIEFKKITP